MSRRLQIDIATLAKKTEWLREQKRIIVQQRKKLAECLEDINTYWDGVAAKEFYNRVSADIDMLDRYLSLIEKVVSDYAVALEKYRNSEEQISDIIKAISII